MKTYPLLPSVLAGVAVGSLLIYVLACATSFSPDDRQVLYPSFDPQSGAAAVALYDRKTGRSETVYAAAAAAAATNQSPVLMRAGWLPDGKHILIGEATDHKSLELFVLPRGAKDPVRHFSLDAGDDAEACLVYPFAVVGSQLFLNGDGRNPLRLDLATGETAGGGKTTNEICVLPSPDGKAFIGFREVKGGDTEVGTFDPQTGQFNPLVRTGTNVAEGTLPVFDPADGRLIFISQTGDTLQLQVVKNGQTEFTRPLARDGVKLQTGVLLDLTPDGKTVLTAYCAVPQAKTNAEYGLLEIPLSTAPLRFTPLFRAGQDKDAGAALVYAQASLSHDGKTWAIGTACLYLVDESLKPENCALFLVDLSKSSRPVTKVPIQVPTKRKPLTH